MGPGVSRARGPQTLLSMNMSFKMSRCPLFGALGKHRGKGQQKVTVEHVHVHDDGQAVVGNVERPGG